MSNSVKNLLNKPDVDIMEILSATEFTIQSWNNLANAAYAYVDAATTIVDGKRHIQLVRILNLIHEDQWSFKEEKMKEDKKRLEMKCKKAEMSTSFKEDDFKEDMDADIL
ncbi:hypothetical protein HK096_008135, partial [Nowakowskiella sp. JEL0078]